MRGLIPLHKRIYLFAVCDLIGPAFSAATFVHSIEHTSIYSPVKVDSSVQHLGMDGCNIYTEEDHHRPSIFIDVCVYKLRSIRTEEN